MLVCAAGQFDLDGTTMRRMMLVLGAAALLGACGPPLEWVRPNPAAPQIQQDLAECDNSAIRETRYGYWAPWYPRYGYWDSHDYMFARQQYLMDQQLDEQRLRDFCMRSRGYKLQQIPNPQ